MSAILTQKEMIENVAALVIENFGSIENFALAYNKMLDQEKARIEEHYEMYDKQHGSFFDRGSADSYYGRPRDPHRGGVGGFSGPREAAVAAEDIEAYDAGYEWNEIFGGKKEY